MMRLSGLILAAALGACTPAAQESQAATTALTAAGDPVEQAPETDSDSLQWAASVVRVDFLANQTGGGAKLFGTAGGDPAMNGLYAYIAFFQGPADGWRVFRLGDYLDYRVLSDAPGRVDLEIQESTMNGDGEIGGRTFNVIVSWTRGADGAAPDTVSVTPARAG
jgi:hypothetical protein